MNFVSEDVTNNIERIDAEIADLEGKIAASGDSSPQAQDEAERRKTRHFNDSVEKTMSDVWDKLERQEEKKPEMPSIEGGRIAERMERSHEWLHLSKAEKKLQSDAAKDVSEMKAIAEKYGVSLAEAEAIKQTELMKSANEHAPAVEHLRGAFSGSTPVESAKWFRDTTEAFRRDPIATLAHLGSQAGLHPMQVAQAIAQRYGNQPMQGQHQSNDAALAAMESTVAQFAEKNPRLNDLEDEVVGILQSDAFQRSTQPPQVKLKAALDVAMKRDKSGTLDEKLERSMRRIANKQGLR
jgi:DNA polymerase III delta prime subunit